MISKEESSFFATVALGMESLLAQELRDLGAQAVQQEKAGVRFQGSLELAYRVCLWSRFANRVLLPLKKFAAPDPDRLYGGVRGIHWTDHLDVEGTLAVDFSSSHSKITHTHYGALKVKDAIVDQFRAVKGSRPSVDPFRPSIRVNVYVHKDEATVSLDLSGDSLHKRGYREERSAAPLKENLAAALLKLSGWPKTEDVSFLDPMCGSGTLLVEAAWMAARRAPGLTRPYYGFLGWQGHVPRLWKRLLQEAEELEIRDRKKIPKIVGYDIHPRAIRTALAHIEKAGLRGKVHAEVRDFIKAEKISEKGVLITNPPYGERLGEVEQLKGVYENLGDVLKQRFKGWDGFVFTGNPELAKSIGLKASRRHVLFNGPIECRLLEFSLY
jgi:23S rRNA (guanine2445-N2)-methyltransferase / 23S rRNA (guanine2069-N7)-methyltransferase